RTTARAACSSALVAEAREAVRPWVQEWDAHGGAAAGILRHAGARIEKLGTLVSERAADHARTDGEGGLERSGRRDERPRGVTVDGRLADARTSHDEGN